MKMKKIMCTVLALILAVGALAGCGSGTVKSEAEKNFAETDEKLTLEWLGYATLAGCSEGTQSELLLEERFNVDIKPLFYEATNFNDKKTMLMAGGDIPDLVYELDPVNVFNDVDQDFIVEIPYGTIEKYAPAYYEYLNENVPDAWSYSRYMDANWGIPNLNWYNAFARVAGYRGDWLKNVGKNVPTTLDEMHDVLYAFVYDDPDGNGKDDTFGYAMKGTDYQYFFTEIFGAYGVMPFDWQEVDGEIVYGGLREECTQVLQIIADWYEEGLIHPDFISGTSLSTLATTNQIGYYQQIAFQNDEDPTSLVSGIRQITPEAEYVYAAPPSGPDGLRGVRVWGELCHIVSFGNTEQYGVAVPRMLQMFDGMFTDEELSKKIELGNEGEHWEAVDKATGKTTFAYGFKGEYQDAAARRLSGITDSLGAPSFFKPIALKREFYMDNMTDKYRNWLETYAPADAALADVFYKVDIVPSSPEYLVDLRNKQMALMAEIIQGTKSADSYITEFSKMWSKGGGDILLEEAREHKNVIDNIYKDLGIK